jgi:hypothetical protein
VLGSTAPDSLIAMRARLVRIDVWTDSSQVIFVLIARFDRFAVAITIADMLVGSSSWFSVIIHQLDRPARACLTVFSRFG